MRSKRYLYWPVRLMWCKRVAKHQKFKWFITHGWQVGWDGVGMGVFGWTFHLGQLKVCFGGEKFKKKPHKQVKINE